MSLDDVTTRMKAMELALAHHAGAAKQEAEQIVSTATKFLGFLIAGSVPAPFPPEVDGIAADTIVAGSAMPDRLEPPVKPDTQPAA